jgi:hypothetical protein
LHTRKELLLQDAVSSKSAYGASDLSISGCTSGVQLGKLG